MGTWLEQRRKGIIAFLTVAAGIIAGWQDAPEWVLALGGLIGAILVYMVPNEPMP